MDWYAVRTAPNHEAAVNKKVKGYGLTTFYPRIGCRKFTHRKEVRWIERPHFPTYLFVKAEPHQLRLVRKANGQIVMFAGKPTEIPGKVMAALQAGTDETGMIKMVAHDLARVRFKKMQQVVFTDGPFVNTLAQVVLDSGGDTIRILLQVLGAKREITAQIAQIRAACRLLDSASEPSISEGVRPDRPTSNGQQPLSVKGMGCKSEPASA